jgi:amino acid adenylation domain-containing protein
VCEGVLVIADIKEFLAKKLPTYMVPSFFVTLDKIPLTPNGKVDRSALPAPGIIPKKLYTTPRNKLEEKLVGIWSDVLGMERDMIGIDSDFFDSGGHSIKATMLVYRIHKALDVRLPLEEVFKGRTIRELAGYIEKAIKEQYSGIEPVEKKEYYELSSAQKRLYFLQQMEPGSITYNMPSVLPPGKNIEKSKLESILKRLIARHESLRTSFEKVNEEVVQRIHDPGTMEFAVEYYQVEDKDEIEHIIDNFIRPFDLSRVPLIRSGIVKNPGGSHTWVVDMHHIVSDGTSRVVLTQDFMSLYHGEELEPLRLQYKDFSRWQNHLFEGGAIKAREDYWLGLYPDIGEIPRLNFPGDYKRPRVFTFTGNQYRFELDRDDAVKFKVMGKEIGGTLYMNTLAALNALFYKYTGQTDIIIGGVVSGRPHADLEHIIGMFVNTVAMRNRPEGGKSYRAFLKEVIAHSVEAFENQDVQFEELVERLEPQRDLSRNPLFDITMVVQNFDVGEVGEGPELPVVEMEGEIRYTNKTAKFDMTFFVVERGEDVCITIEYYLGIFKEETIQRLVSHFKNVIKAVVGNPLIKLEDIEVMSGEERQQVLYTFNDTAGDYPKDKTIHELFEEQVDRTPDSVGLAGKSVGMRFIASVTYRELDEKSDRLAHHLREEGVQPDTIVGIMMGRSVEMIIGILGILKAGGAYLPTDPDYPEERKQYILKDSGAKILLTNLPEGRFIHRSSDPFIIRHSSNLAYVIYTSGTTGRPKGVLIHHQGVVNMVWFHRRVFAEHPGSYGSSGSRISQVSSPAFDAMAFEIWPCLLTGACLCIVDDETRMHPRRLKEWLIRHQVTISFQSTIIALALLDEPWPESGTGLKALRTAGDRLGRYPARPYPFRFYNLYGPTEDTVWTTWTEVPVVADPPGGVKSPSIGKPVANKRVYILSSSLKMQPVGVVGELCISGDGLAHGYLNRPELTNEKFDRDLWDYHDYRDKIEARTGENKQKLLRGVQGGSNRSPLPGAFLEKGPPGRRGQRIYKTGDQGRWLPDGNIEFMGRIDQQVKIRGFRIELEEIENRLSAHPGIKRAVVIDRTGPGGEKYLCAYLVCQMPLSADALEAFLSRSLPGYMIPSYFVPREEIPLTPNGKIDRRALPAPGLKQEEYIAPRDPIEKKLVDIWSVVLEVEKEKIGIDDNFFRLGGHSLKATLVMSGINRELGVRVPLVELFKTPTIRQLSEYIIGAKGEISTIGDNQLVLLKRRGGKAKPFFFIHDGSGEVEGYIEFCNRLSGAYDSWGIQAQKIENYAPLNLSIEESARRYIEKMRVVQAHGPYRIAGWSIGGTIGFEMVRRLEEENEDVCFLGLIDTVPPDKDLAEKGIEFNLESELKLIRDYFPGGDLIKKLQGIGDFSRVWPGVLAYLEGGEFKLDHDNDGILKNVVPGDFAQTVPNPDRMSIKEFIIYLNMVRTFANARNNYIPGGKINTAVHFFKAKEGEVIDAEKWSIYCHKPIKVYDIAGDHFSLLKMPGVMEFVKLFGKITNK